MLVADATAGGDPNLVIAALLHDAIEDSKVPLELIATAFGEDCCIICVKRNSVCRAASGAPSG